MREVRRVCAGAFVFEKQRQFVFRQRTLPHAHCADVSAGEITGKVRRGAAYFEDMPLLIRRRELCLLRDLLSIQPKTRGAAAQRENCGVRLAIVHHRTAGHRAEPADVIHQPSAANEERLRIRRPLALGCALGEQRAFTFRFKGRHRGEIRAEIKVRIRKVPGTCLRQGRHIHRSTHELSSAPNAEHRRAIRRIFHGDVMRAFRIEHDRQIIAQLHFRSAIQMKTIVQRPPGCIEWQ